MVKRPTGRVLTPSGIVREVNAVQPSKTVLSTILVSTEGSKMDVREVFPLNVAVFNTVTWVADKLMDGRAVHPPNTTAPSKLTVDGIITDVKEVHAATIPAGRNVVPVGKIIDLRDVQVLN